MCDGFRNVLLGLIIAFESILVTHITGLSITDGQLNLFITEVFFFFTMALASFSWTMCQATVHELHGNDHRIGRMVHSMTQAHQAFQILIPFNIYEMLWTKKFLLQKHHHGN